MDSNLPTRVKGQPRQRGEAVRVRGSPKTTYSLRTVEKKRRIYTGRLFCAFAVVLAVKNMLDDLGNWKLQAELLASKNTRRPNLLFIMTDQQRHDALSIAGNKVLHTPNMDRIAREGVYFTNAYSQCPVCGPARTSLLTGLSIDNTNIRTNAGFSDINITNAATYDEYLVDVEGYIAEYYGKWHAPVRLKEKYRNNVSRSLPAPYLRYLDEAYPHKPNELENGTHIQSFNRRPYRTNPMDSRHGLPPDSGHNENQPDQHGTSEVPEEHTLTAFQAKDTIKALERLAQNEQNKPFSLHCSFACPHPPITPSEPYASMYKIKDMVPPFSIDDPMENSPYLKANARKKVTRYANPELITFMIANYYAYVKEIDVWLGKILDKIDELGLTDNTLLIFTSDHGEMLGAHGMREKSVFYEESVHIPLMMRFPDGMTPRTIVKEPVSHIDIFPTIFDYLGAKKQRSDGESLRELIEGKGADNDKEKYTVSEWGGRDAGVDPGLMIRTKCWKLLLPKIADSEVINVLFDLENDPHEMNNLLGKNPDRPKYLEVAEKLRIMLLEWLIKVDSPWLEEVRKRQL